MNRHYSRVWQPEFDWLEAALGKNPIPIWVLARRIGVSPSSLSGWLRGATPAPSDLKAKLTVALQQLTGATTTSAT